MKTRSKIQTLVRFFISLNQGVQKRSEHPCSVAGQGLESPLHAAVLNACTLLCPASPASSPCYVHRQTRRCGDCQFKVLSLRKEKKKRVSGFIGTDGSKWQRRNVAALSDASHRSHHALAALECVVMCCLAT